MKYLKNLVGKLLILILPFVVCQCIGNSVKHGNSAKIKQIVNVGSKPKFEFTKELHKFGEISEGEIVVTEFFFKNAGDRDLFISNIESSCGCTVVKWEKKPIKKGEESKITVEFDSHGRYGSQYKVIRVISNATEKRKKLIITATVK